MLVEHAQVGCVLGKGGEVISDLRRRTGANIRVSDKRDLPACAGSEDSLIAVRLAFNSLIDVELYNITHSWTWQILSST